MEKKILVACSSPPPLEEYVGEIRGIFESRWLTNMGVKHEALAEELHHFFDAPEVTLFQNGHLAFEFVLQALGLRGEAITASFTFASTTWATIRAGPTPVFCDIDPETYTLDPVKLEALTTPRTATILPVHVYGTLCDTDALTEIAVCHHPPLIYDTVHAFGVKKDGKSAASSGDVAVSSFHVTKVSHTTEGGAVYCHDPELSQKLFRLKNFGTQENETYCIGDNDETNGFEAAMGLCNLRHFPEEIIKRKRVYERCRERLTGATGPKLPLQQVNVTPNYAYSPVISLDAYGETRDEVAERLQARGCFPWKYFYPCINAFPFLGQCYTSENMSIAAAVSRRVLTLLLYADLECADVDEICRILRREV